MTLGGEQLLSFAKATEFEDDLYSGLVAPKLASNLLTETWNNGIKSAKKSFKTKFIISNFNSLIMKKENMFLRLYKVYTNKMLI